MLGQRQRLLTSTTKHKGVSSLEAHHHQASSGPIDQHLIDLLLSEGVPSSLLAYEDQLRRFRSRFELRWVQKAIVDHHLGHFQAAQRFHGD
jgi:hypothetical protein